MFAGITYRFVKSVSIIQDDALLLFISMSYVESLIDFYLRLLRWRCSLRIHIYKQCLFALQAGRGGYVDRRRSFSDPPFDWQKAIILPTLKTSVAINSNIVIITALDAHVN